MPVTKAMVIFTHFSSLSDPRLDRRKQHNLFEMVVLALTAAICGAEGWTDVERFGKDKMAWFCKFLQLENGIPSHDTFGRVFARLDTEEFLTCLGRWIDSLQLALAGQGVHIDGKTARRSFDRATGKSALHVVSAWAGDLRICLGQVAVDNKSNEITAVPKLLELLELSGAVVTLDAMHCQKETAAAIRKQQADYILTVKANQPSLYHRLHELFVAYGENNYRDREVRSQQIKQTNRGRKEERVYHVAPVPADLKAKGQWKDIQSVGMVYRHREVDGKQSDEVCFFISSLPPKVRLLAKQLRGHWRVENSLHWVLDVTFAEDACRIRKGNGAEIASIFRRLALTILQRDTTLKETIRGKRLRAGWNHQILEAILCGTAA